MTTKTASLFSKFSLLVFSTLLSLTLLTGCGGPSSEDVRSIGTLIDEFEGLNDEGSRQLASGESELGYPFILKGYEDQLELIKAHRANHTYEGDIKKHLDAMEEGLTEGIVAYRKWIEAGYNNEKPAPDELAAVNDFGIKLTSAETALGIIADK